MSSILLMLAMHQDIQERVIEEFDLVFPNTDTEIGGENINELKYFDLVIKEAMRLFPVAPIIGRRMEADFKLDGKWHES